MAAERVGKATQNKQMTHEVILSFNHVSECVCVFDIIVCSRTVLFCVFQLVFMQSGRGGEEVGDAVEAEEICWLYEGEGKGGQRHCSRGAS